jgi:hypothetical protein
MRLETPEERVVKAMARHHRRRAMVRAGRQRDQLLRSLLPLYVAQTMRLDLDSGAIARIWRRFNVPYAVPNAAKALREHVGFARRTPLGRRITRAGIRYVERALSTFAPG